jgi:hypothetical protein
VRAGRGSNVSEARAGCQFRVSGAANTAHVRSTKCRSRAGRTRTRRTARNRTDARGRSPVGNVRHRPDACSGHADGIARRLVQKWLHRRFGRACRSIPTQSNYPARSDVSVHELRRCGGHKTGPRAAPADNGCDGIMWVLPELQQPSNVHRDGLGRFSKAMAVELPGAQRRGLYGYPNCTPAATRSDSPRVAAPSISRSASPGVRVETTSLFLTGFPGHGVANRCNGDVVGMEQ